MALFAIVVPRDVVPLGTEYAVDHEGFLAGALSAEQRALSDVPRTASIAVLGEPGIGKSRALRELTEQDGAVLHISLDTVADLQDLKERLLTPPGSGEGGKQYPFTLVVDSIDESPIPAKTLAYHLDQALQLHPVARILLGCRTADWPDGLVQQLTAHAPDLEVVELLPLRRTDIQLLAESRGLNGEQFLSAVVEAGAAPLAGLPLTLDLLLLNYRETGRLPDTASEIYRQGLERLVEEPDRDRETAKRPAGTAPQRLAVACRLASYALLCDRTAIARAAPSANDELLAGDLAGGTESIAGGQFQVTEDLIEGALGTALFSGRGRGRLTVAHASFSAYLTARYLNQSQVSEQQVRALITRTNSLGRTRVPPRLHETAAWLVALDPRRHGWLVDVDPDSIASHSVLVRDADIRRALVAYLLESPDPELRTGRRRWRLDHPQLAEQLRPVMRAPLTQDAGPHFGHPVSRRAQVAIEIARRAGGEASVPDLVNLLRCDTINSYLRASAAYALRDLNRMAAADALREVLVEVLRNPEHDPDDELRGLALEANWPYGLSAAELAAVLTPARNSELIGAYKMFLYRFLDNVGDEVIRDLVRAVTPSGWRDVGITPLDEWVDEDDLSEEFPSEESPHTLLAGGRRGSRVMATLLARALESDLLSDVVEEVGWLIATALQNHLTVSMPRRFESAPDQDGADVRLRRSLLLAVCDTFPRG